MIRPAVTDDFDKILNIYAAARSFMRRNGNPDQWGDTHPPSSMLEADIKKGWLYVVELDEEICGCFAMIDGEDPTYNYIDGKWISDEKYTAVHRVASSGTQKGIVGIIMDFVKERCGHIRIDTHENNLPMQKALSKNGFVHCGTIFLENGDPRLAYAWIKKG